jgi:glycosyltransferase involved in cell wall biosynthesis
MKILVIHNYYKVAGGEDAVMRNEIELLKKNNEQVMEYKVNNTLITSFWQKVRVMLNTVYSFSQYKLIKRILSETSPDLVHVHNYFPLISPAVFYACKKMNIPVVHTLHNYRAVCPTALLMYGGEICEKSLQGSAWWAVTKRVYRNSFIGSFTLTIMVEIHKKIGTWQVKVDRFIALTEFARNKYAAAGWPERKITVKANFTEDFYDQKLQLVNRGGYALFIGRLSEEKGINTLFTAWKDISFLINVIGEGDVDEPVETSIKLLGRKAKEDVISLIKSSRFIVVPSICYEGFPMAIVEAFSCGTPVICSRIGSMEEIVNDGVTGLHFEAGNSADLVEKVKWMVEHPDEARQMGENARNEYLAKYTPQKNYEILMDIYQQAIDEAKGINE